jgi:hypothetical protein
MPIEWDDGTACELDPTEWRRVCDGEELTAYMVVGIDTPRGWNAATMPKLSTTKPVMVNPDGTLDAARGPGAPRIVNTQMPLLRFPDATNPIAGRIFDRGTKLRLVTASGQRYLYVWPRLTPINGAPKLVEVTVAQLEAEEAAAAEQAAMLDNPMFGMF